jgi:hypothetical protein
MKKYYCDKCGKEMTQEQYEKPYFYISKYNIVDGERYCKDVVLCAECKSKFIKWLGEKE